MRLDGGAACRSRRGRRRWRRRQRRRRRSNRCSRCRSRILQVGLYPPPSKSSNNLNCRQIGRRVRRRCTDRCQSTNLSYHLQNQALDGLDNQCTYWCRRPEGGMCRMRAGSLPTPRDSHSTRWDLCCKSCTEPIHKQCHQSRTSRCSLHPSRGSRVGAAGAAGAAESGYAECGYAVGVDGADDADDADGGCAMETTGMG